MVMLQKVMISAEVLVISEGDERNEWVLDSRCSFHMTPSHSWLHSYKELDEGKVLLGNNKQCDVVGIGEVKLKLANETVKILQEVRHVPDLKRYLISVGVLDSKGYSIKVEFGSMKVSKGSMVVMKGLRQNGLYILQAETITGEAGSVQSKNSEMQNFGIGDLATSVRRGCRSYGSRDC